MVAVSAPALVMGGAATLWATAASPAARDCEAQAAALSSKPPEAVSLPRLEVSELLESGAQLKPTAKAAELKGKRVRLVGYMAEMELPPTGAFYLVPRPVKLDEAGGGTADLPLESVLVTSPALEGTTWTYVPGPLEGVGVLEVGNQSDARGRVSNFRLELEAEATPAIRRTVSN